MGQQGQNRRYYRARAKEWDVGTSSTGKDQVAVVFEYADGDQKGRRITGYLFLTDKTLDRTVEALKIMSGIEVPDLADLKDLDKNEVELVVEEEEWEGETHDRIKFVNRVGGLNMKNRLDAAGKVSLAERLRGRVVAAAQKVASSPSAPASAGGGRAPSSEDDIPF